jgi:CBS domain-containing protein
MKVADILRSKGDFIYAVSPDITVFEALKIMGEKNIGALLVMKGEQLKGILSERDYARKVVLKGKTSLETLVQEIMTEDVISVHPHDTIDRCMELMSENHIRHLPVMEGSRVKGVISVNDVVKAIIAAQKETIESLQSYIMQ